MRIARRARPMPQAGPGHLATMGGHRQRRVQSTDDRLATIGADPHGPGVGHTERQSRS